MFDVTISYIFHKVILPSTNRGIEILRIEIDRLELAQSQGCYKNYVALIIFSRRISSGSGNGAKSLVEIARFRINEPVNLSGRGNNSGNR